MGYEDIYEANQYLSRVAVSEALCRINHKGNIYEKGIYNRRVLLSRKESQFILWTVCTLMMMFILLVFFFYIKWWIAFSIDWELTRKRTSESSLIIQRYGEWYAFSGLFF